MDIRRDTGPWRFARFAEPSEDHLNAQGTIADFWAAFSAAAPDLSEGLQTSSETTVPKIRALVEQIGVCWELGRSSEGFVLAFTTEGEYIAQPFIEAVVEAAPEIPGWKFRSSKPADPDLALQMVEARTGVRLIEPSVAGQPGDNNQMNIIIAVEADQVELAQSTGAAVVLVEVLLGERDLDVWVGGIFVEDKADFELNEPSFLPKILDMHKERAGIQDMPWSQVDLDDVDWSLMKREGEEPELPEDGRDVMLALSTPAPSILLASQNSRFFSERFTKHNETFCELSIGEQLQPDDRSAIEDQVNLALRNARAGSVIGGGTGVLKSYIYMAIADMDKAVPALRAAAEEQELPECVMLFFDADLEGESITICG